MQFSMNMSLDDIKKSLIEGIKKAHNVALQPEDITVRVIINDGDKPQLFHKLEIEVNH